MTDGSRITGAPGDPVVTIITPTILGRADLLATCEASVDAQTVPVRHRTIIDYDGNGPSHVRNLGIEAALTEWVAFVDDDDYLYPQHLELLLARAQSTGADVVYPWFDINGGSSNHLDPLTVRDSAGNLMSPLGVDPMTPGIIEQLDDHNWIPVTLLARRSALLAVGGFPETLSARWPHADCEDWGCWRDLRDAGFRFAHLPVRTWSWTWNGLNTSGKPETARALGLL